MGEINNRMSEKVDELEIKKLPEPQDARRVNFHFIKSTSYRTIHVDGAWGGITPGLNINMAVFNERGAIPRQVVLEVSESGTTREIQEERIVRDAVIREVEADLIMDLPTAEAVLEWLGKKVEELKTIYKIRETQQGSEKP